MCKEQVAQALRRIANVDAQELAVKDATYGSSWRKRGGVGAFMMMARKFDRLEQTFQKHGNACINTTFHDGDSVVNDIRDMRRYGLLVAEARSVGGINPTDWTKLRAIAEGHASLIVDITVDVGPSALEAFGVLAMYWRSMEDVLRRRYGYDFFNHDDRRISSVDHDLAEVIKHLYMIDYLWLPQPAEAQEQHPDVHAAGAAAVRDGPSGTELGSEAPGASALHPQ